MIMVFDNVLDNFEEYKNKLSYARFNDVISQGKKYTDISQDLSSKELYNFVNKHIKFNTSDVISFVRAYKNRPNSDPVTWIHSDRAFSEYIAVFFAQSSKFYQDDGFCIWKNKDLNSISALSKEDHEYADTQTLNPENWEIYSRVEFKPNRLVICPASYFHSTSTYGHHGDSVNNCRIVHVLFFNKDSADE